MLARLAFQRRIVILVATASAAIGLILLAAADSAYTSTAFRWTFTILPRRVWGLAFVLTGAIAASCGDRPIGRTAGAVLTVLLFLYGLSLAAALITGEAQSASGWAWPITAGGVLALARPITQVPRRERK